MHLTSSGEITPAEIPGIDSRVATTFAGRNASNGVESFARICNDRPALTGITSLPAAPLAGRRISNTATGTSHPHAIVSRSWLGSVSKRPQPASHFAGKPVVSPSIVLLELSPQRCSHTEGLCIPRNTQGAGPDAFTEEATQQTRLSPMQIHFPLHVRRTEIVGQTWRSAFKAVS